MRTQSPIQMHIMYENAIKHKSKSTQNCSHVRKAGKINNDSSGSGSGSTINNSYTVLFAFSTLFSASFRLVHCKLSPDNIDFGVGCTTFKRLCTAQYITMRRIHFCLDGGGVSLLFHISAHREPDSKT